jgi:tetratricopeptide (TPR) repeat protein
MISAKTQNDVNAALRSNQMDRAGLIAEEAIAHGESHETLFSLAALRRRQFGDNRGAVALYDHALRLAPDNPGILAAAGDAMRYTGQLKEAVKHFDQALEHEPMMIAAWYGRALALEAQGVLEDARYSYTRVTELAPDAAAGFAGLASMQAQLAETVDARRNAKRAQELAPAESGTIMALARCDIAEGHHDHAAKWLRTMLDQQGLVPEDEIIAGELLGDSLDKLGLADEAFGSYSRANARFATVHAGSDIQPVARHAIEAINTGLASLAPGALAVSSNTSPTAGAAGHVFLLGYPRSGTTLTEQILATIPNVVSLEEAPTLAAGEKFLSADGIAALVALGDDEVAALRNDYWAVVAAAGINVSGQTFIDMDPLKGPALPLIAQLFPDARIIFMHRDPRDVVWSCFRRNFVYSPVACEFTTLERAAQHYNAVMSLIRRCFEMLPLNVHILRYEELVRDFERTTQNLCAFLDLPWSSGLRDFGLTARARTVRTASGPQVRRALFDGSGQWTRYADRFEPLMPLLETWIAPPELSSGGKS